MEKKLRLFVRGLGFVFLTLSIMATLVAFAHDDDPAEQEGSEIQPHFTDDFLAHAEAAFAQGQGGENRPPRSRNVSVVGHLSFGESASNTTNTDVWAHGKFAYVGTFSSPACAGDLGLGVKIVDISNPSNPQWIGNLASPPGTRANDVKVARVETAFFEGDLLVHTNEPCPGGGDGGIRLYDVTNPASPVHLADFYSIGSPGPGPGPAAFGVHNTYLYTKGDRAYVLVVANISPNLYDTRIVDVTNPSAPTEAGRWSATVSPDAPSGLETRGTSRSLGIHDVWANDNGKLGVLSYWDSGYILLDINDPTNPRFLGNSSWATGDEGNAHAAVPARGDNLIIATDEDFSANGLALMTTNVALGSFGTQHEAIEGAFTLPLANVGGSLTGGVAWAGLGDTEQDTIDDSSFGCLGGKPYGESVAGKIALIKRGFCTFQDKIARAQSEGAVAAIVFNDAREDLVFMGGTGVGIPGVFIRGSRGEALAALRGAGTSVTATLAQGAFDGWGFARIFDTSNKSNIRLLSTIKLPSTNDQAAPNPFGVHNVFVRGNTAYFSWYMDGFVAVDFSQPKKPRVIAEFNDNNFFWGIYVQGDLIFASDRNSGLWIFKLKP